MSGSALLSTDVFRALSRSMAVVLIATACAKRAAMPAGASVPLPSAELTREIGVAEGASLAALPAGPGHDLVMANCIICHSASMIVQQRKDSAGWEKTLTQMVAWGAPLTDAQRPELMAYLTSQFGVTAARH